MRNHLCGALSVFFICTGVRAESVTETQYAQASLYETTGLLGGIFIGGITGGPPGAIIASGIGALLGENWNEYKESKSKLEVALNDANNLVSEKNNKLALLQKQYDLTQVEINLLKNSPPSTLPTYQNVSSNLNCCENIVTSIYFRSGQSNIEPHYEEQLISMVDLIKKINNLRIEITGFADRNGDDRENLDLSNRRTNSVKSFFNERGVEHNIITTLAFGETQPLKINQTAESDFFDRRVVVRFLSNNRSMLTRLPDAK